MTLGYNTRTISAPVGTTGMYGPTSPAVKFVPLSMFFLNMQGKEDEEDEDKDGVFYGKMKVDKKKNRGKDPGLDVNGKTVDKKTLSKPRKPSVGGPEPMKRESVNFPVLEGKINKPQKCSYCKKPAENAYIWADGRAYIPVCKDHGKIARRRIEKKNNDEVTAIREIPQRQSTTSEQVSSVQVGATRSSSGAMGTGNIAKVPVPIGSILRRVTPIGDDLRKKRKKRRLEGEEKNDWINRLLEIAK